MPTPSIRGLPVHAPWQDRVGGARDRLDRRADQGGRAPASAGPIEGSGAGGAADATRRGDAGAAASSSATSVGAGGSLPSVRHAIPAPAITTVAATSSGRTRERRAAGAAATGGT